MTETRDFQLQAMQLLEASCLFSFTSYNKKRRKEEEKKECRQCFIASRKIKAGRDLER